MDPAFSLADELNFHNHEPLDFEQDLQFHSHPHTLESLDDELSQLDQPSEYNDHSLPSSIPRGGGGLSLDAELDALHLQPALHSHTEEFSGSHTPKEEVGSTISILASKQAMEMGESIAATQGFLSQLSAISSSSATTGMGAGEGDTERLEQNAARYLTLVSQCTAEREAQVRELRELDRRCARLFSSPTSSLPSSSSFGALSPPSPGLPDLIEDESFSTPSSPPSPIISRSHQPTGSISSDTTITNPLPPLTSEALLEASLFTPLYTSTTQLLTSLTGLHEHTQITKSSTADAARKLKTLKGLIAQWKLEQQSVETSEEWIQTHKVNVGVGEGGRKGSEWVQKEVEEVRERLERFEREMKGVLVPVSVAV